MLLIISNPNPSTNRYHYHIVDKDPSSPNYDTIIGQETLICRSDGSLDYDISTLPDGMYLGQFWAGKTVNTVPPTTPEVIRWNETPTNLEFTVPLLPNPFEDVRVFSDESEPA